MVSPKFAYPRNSRNSCRAAEGEQSRDRKGAVNQNRDPDVRRDKPTVRSYRSRTTVGNEYGVHGILPAGILMRFSLSKVAGGALNQPQRRSAT
jgi:hypothetical protein